MRFLILADAHLGAYNDFDVNGSRLERCIQAVALVFHIAQTYRVDAIISCGDTIDQKDSISFKVYNAIYDLFSNYREYLAVVRWYEDLGNHSFSTKTGVTNIHPLSHLLIEIAQPTIVPFKNTDFFFIPYCHDLRAWTAIYEQAAAAAARSQRPHRILVIHQEIRGAVTGTHRYVAGDGIDPEIFRTMPFTFCVAGHYHKQQFFPGPNGEPRAMYCGALLQQDFGEEGNPQGVWIFDDDPVEMDPWTWIPIASPEFRTYPPEQVGQMKPTDFNRIFATKKQIDELPTPPPGVHLRIEPIHEQENVNRLGVRDFSDVSALVEAYIQARVEPEMAGMVRKISQDVVRKAST